MLGLSTRIPALEQTFDFSTAVIHVPVSVYVRDDMDGISDAATLRGFHVATLRGHACANELRTRGVTDVSLHDSATELVNTALAGIDVTAFSWNSFCCCSWKLRLPRPRPRPRPRPALGATSANLVLIIASS